MGDGHNPKSSAENRCNSSRTSDILIHNRNVCICSNNNTGSLIINSFKGNNSKKISCPDLNTEKVFCFPTINLNSKIALKYQL